MLSTSLDFDHQIKLEKLGSKFLNPKYQFLTLFSP